MASERLNAIFRDYARFHRHPTNKLCHHIGIPLIVFTVVGLLAKIELALPVMAAALLYQLSLSVTLTLVFAVFVALSFVTASAFSGPVLWSGFALGWVLQLVGHYVFEKRSPAFFTNLVQLLAGPLWIIGSLTGMPSSPPDSEPLVESAPKR